MAKLKGNKTYRHRQNPQEKEFHDKFIKFCSYSSGTFEQVSMPTDDEGRIKEYLTKREKEIMISTIQWLGSPVGQSFLNDCGFKLKD